MNRPAAVSPPSFIVFAKTELSDRPADRACVEKNRPVQAGRRFVNFQTDTVWTTRV